MKKILFFLGHPAHFHLFKNSIQDLKESGSEIHIVIKTKDILEDLLKSAKLPYSNLLPEGRKDGKLGILNGVLKKNLALFKYCKEHQPDIMAGTSAEIAHVGKLLSIPSINFTEDDYKIIRNFGRVTYPFTDVILSPVSCNNERWNKKTVHYNGYHKLAYLHPNRFKPDIGIVNKYISDSEPYYILRFAKLTAHHDDGIEGINNDIAKTLVDKLSKNGKVLITSERILPDFLEPYRLVINPLDIHHLMAYANLFIGDSQSMTVESAMLGTPSLRFSSFSGKIGVLQELEEKYNLTIGIHPSKPDQLMNEVDKMLSQHDLKEKYRKRRDDMLKDKIDTASFFSWFISSFPKNMEIMRKNPAYDERFK